MNISCMYCRARFETVAESMEHEHLKNPPDSLLADPPVEAYEHQLTFECMGPRQKEVHVQLDHDEAMAMDIMRDWK